MEYKNLKIQDGTSHDVELLFDTPKPIDTTYGEKFLYGLKKEGEEYNFFATPFLHTKLNSFRKGDVIKISRNKVSGKTVWDVEKLKAGNTQSNQQMKSTDTGVIDARTHDIHKQVCLKLAIEMREKNDKLLTDTDLIMIEANMKNLLNILEGTKETKETTEEEMPF
tara:strand:+ start:248 stop:745 length:498 start_codon:yes stop_codon:yes gene_type:complete